ncbi:MAG: hypothetical protein CR979_02510, partial [Propionibacterium sp.]
MNMNFNIRDAEHVDFAMDLAINKELADQAGRPVDSEDLCNQDSRALAQGEVKSYDDGNFVGCKISGSAAANLIKYQNIDLDEETNEWTFQMLGTDIAEHFQADNFSEFKIMVTFPGKILSHSGSSTVNGHTVTWSDPKDLFSAGGLKATAYNGNGPGVDWLLLAGIIASALTVIAFMVLSVVKPRHQKLNGEQ